MVRLDHKSEVYRFEEKTITLQRKQDKDDQLKQVESDKNGMSISNAVSSSILVVMEKFIKSQTDKEEQEEKDRREDRERRRQLEEILANMKQENDTPVPTLSLLLDDFSNISLP